MSSQQRSSRLLIRLLIVSLIVSLPASALRQAQRGASVGLVLARSNQPQASELLTNPGFEQPFSQHGSADIFVANGWTAWYLTPDGVNYPTDCKGKDVTCKPYRTPVYRNTQPQDAKQPPRARSGDSQQWGVMYAIYIAGVYQHVAGITPGTRLNFSAYMQGFNCDDDRGCFGGVGEYGKSYEPGDMQTRIGIDPTGGTDPYSSNIVWSPYQNPLDAFSRHEVEAVAQGDSVTVFLWSSPTFPELHTDIYVDDASLIAVGQGPAPETPTSAAPTPTTAPGTPQATLPAGTGTYSVQSGDTLSAIALQYNLTLDQLLALNPTLTRDTVLQVGQVLNVGGTPAPTTQATTSATETPKPTLGAPTVGAPTATATPGGPATYTVKSGDTLSSIAAQFNLSLDQLLAYNGITKDTPLLVGQTLTVGAPAITPTPPLTLTQAATLKPTPTISTSTPAPTPLPGTSASGLCLSAFDDTNGSGTRDSGEGLAAGVKFEVKSADGKSVATYTSDGVKEPSCLTNLPDGRYSVEVTPPAGQLATTDTRWSLSLLSGTAVNIVFGSQSPPTAPTTAAGAAAAPTAAPTAAASANGSSSLTLLVGGAFVLLAVAALFLGLRPRRK